MFFTPSEWLFHLIGGPHVPGVKEKQSLIRPLLRLQAAEICRQVGEVELCVGRRDREILRQDHRLVGRTVGGLEGIREQVKELWRIIGFRLFFVWHDQLPAVADHGPAARVYHADRPRAGVGLRHARDRIPAVEAVSGVIL